MPEHHQDKHTGGNFAELEPLGFKGRIGRLRYITWQFTLWLIVHALGVVSFFVFIISPPAGIVVFILSLIVASIIGIRIAAQRLHDFNWSAWTLILQLVPVANLVVIIMVLAKPGDTGPNRFGLPPPPNSPTVKVVATILAFILALYIAAMIAVVSLGYLDTFLNAASNNTL
ncbi:DUF805 domain-containing protein [Pseudomonas psychrophila]|uniref:DUF805 domain-containing protein n=1 Tax=Pseudomonas psychrophila TaxID=122355 RepID=UPI00036D97E0|nr:DUF805 domain-containing protein [Pseudomonas psychrophila]